MVQLHVPMYQCLFLLILHNGQRELQSITSRNDSSRRVDNRQAHGLPKMGRALFLTMA